MNAEQKERFKIILFNCRGKNNYRLFDNKLNQYATKEFYSSSTAARNMWRYLIESCGRWY